MTERSVEDLTAEIVEMLQNNLNIRIKNDTNNMHGAILKLESLGSIKYNTQDDYIWVLTEEGREILKSGSPEYIFFNSESTDIKIGGIGFNYAMKNKWIKLEKGKIIRLVENVEDKTRQQLKKVEIFENQSFSQTTEKKVELTENELENLKKRKLINKKKVKEYHITRTNDFFNENKKMIKEITTDILLNRKYSCSTLKDYNFNTLGILPKPGALHPILKIKDEFRTIFLEMGFEEMETNRFVESSFWNFDALFQPQCHPSRDVQDTFFLEHPKRTFNIPEDYMKRVKQMHTVGGYDSDGYNFPWDEDETRKNILRTHTTAISTRYLYHLAKKGFKPCKLFSIDRVFRNESVDATHLAEFNQVEGLICGKNLTLSNLMGILEDFFKKLNFEKIKFKPAFNPYTEPSMEIFAYHPGMKKWIEVGNSGIFRPEMLRPMGLDEDVRVIAWGLSLERPAMIKYELNDIRDLVGKTVSYDFIRKNEVFLL